MSSINWGYFTQLLNLTKSAAIELVTGGSVAGAALVAELNDLSISKFFEFNIDDFLVNLFDEIIHDDSEDNTTTEDVAFEDTTEESDTADGESGSKTFYTVQNSSDAKRLLSDGLPWPTDPHRANLGDGVYAWSSMDDALNYFNLKSKRTSDLQILEFEVLQTDLNKMKQLDLTKMSDDEVNIFLDKYARLNGGTPNHGYDYIQRMTGLGVENYFNKSVYGKLKFKQ